MSLKTECVGLVNLVDYLDHIYDKMPKLLEQYQWHSLQKKKNSISCNNAQYYCFQSAEIKESGGSFSDNYY